MERMKVAELEAIVFDEEESKKIDIASNELLCYIKKQNLTFAEATEALLRCKILLGTVKIISNT